MRSTLQVSTARGHVRRRLEDLKRLGHGMTVVVSSFDNALVTAVRSLELPVISVNKAQREHATQRTGHTGEGLRKSGVSRKLLGHTAVNSRRSMRSTEKRVQFPRR